MVAAAAAVQPACFGRTVVADGVAEEDGLLANEAHALAQPPDVVLGERPPREEDGAVRGVVEALQQLDDRRLACEARRREREGCKRARGGRVDAMRSHGSGLRSAKLTAAARPHERDLLARADDQRKAAQHGHVRPARVREVDPPELDGPRQLQAQLRGGPLPGLRGRVDERLAVDEVEDCAVKWGGVMWQGPLSGSNAPLT